MNRINHQHDLLPLRDTHQLIELYISDQTPVFLQ